MIRLSRAHGAPIPGVPAARCRAPGLVGRGRRPSRWVPRGRRPTCRRGAAAGVRARAPVGAEPALPAPLPSCLGSRAVTGRARRVRAGAAGVPARTSFASAAAFGDERSESSALEPSVRVHSLGTLRRRLHIRTSELGPLTARILGREPTVERRIPIDRRCRLREEPARIGRGMDEPVARRWRSDLERCTIAAWHPRRRMAHSIHTLPRDPQNSHRRVASGAVTRHCPDRDGAARSDSCSAKDPRLAVHTDAAGANRMCSRSASRLPQRVLKKPQHTCSMRCPPGQRSENP